MESKAEKWRDVVGYEGWYEVSNTGRFMRVKKGKSTFIGKVLKHGISADGYKQIAFCVDGISSTHIVSGLVAAAFIGPRPYGFQVNHKDGSKENNFVENLEYVTPSQNVQHAYDTGLSTSRGEKNGRNILCEKDVLHIRELFKEKEMTRMEISAMYGVTLSCLDNISSRQTWGWLK